MSEQGGGGQQGNAGAGTDLAWMIAGAFAAIIAIWFTGKDYILHGLLVYKYYQMELIALFSPSKAHPIMEWLWANKDYPDQINMEQLSQVMNQIGDYYKYFNGMLLFAFSYILFALSPSGHFKKTFDMMSLREQESKNWPQITPVIGLKLYKEDIDKGPWASAQSPMDFCIANEILIPPTRDPRKPNEDLTATIDEEKARACLIKQMGPRLEDPDALPIHMKALVGVFAARALEERDLPHKLLSQISASASDPKNMDFTGSQELFDKYKNEPLIQKVFSNHAYTLTMMAALLEVARSDGVLASADFLWLKPYDRALWYMLNNVGRQTAFAEIAGPFGHWRAEKAMRRRINTPMVEEGVKAFKGAIATIVYTGDKEKWELTLEKF